MTTALVLFTLSNLASVADTTPSINPLVVECEAFCRPNVPGEPNRNACEGVYLRKKSGKPIPTTFYGWPCNRCATGKLCTNSVPLSEVTQACSCDARNPRLDNQDLMNQPVLPATRLELERRKTQIQDWVLCVPSVQSTPTSREEIKKSVKACKDIPGIKYSSDGIDGPSGDATSFLGFACLGGSSDRCNDVKFSQDLDPNSPTYGAFFRNPFAKINDSGVSFSRDAVLGILAYFVKTKDTHSAKLWAQFLDRNPRHRRLPQLPFKQLNVCPKTTISAEPDDRCASALGLNGLIADVYDHLGLLNDKDIPKRLAKKLKSSRVFDNLEAIMGARFAEIKTFNSHLVVRNLLIRKTIGQSNNPTWKRARDVIWNREKPGHPFYEVALFGPSEHAAQLLLRYCSATRPPYGERTSEGKEIQGAWLWDQGIYYFATSQGLPWGNSVREGGHECLMAMEMILNSK